MPIVVSDEEGLYRIVYKAVRAVLSERWMSGPEIAEHFGISYQKWREHTADPEIMGKAMDMGTKGHPLLRWRPFDVEEFLERRKRK